MRLLFTTNPLFGHVLPMLPLMRAAQAAGHQVVVATGPDLVPTLRARGLDVWAAGPPAAEPFARSAALPVVPGESDIDRQLRHARVLFGETGIQRFRQLVARARAWRPDLVVHELTEFAGWELAPATGAVEVVHGFGTHVDGIGPLAGQLLRELSAALRTPDRTHTLATVPYVDPMPLAVQAAQRPFGNVWLVRPETGETRPGDALPAAMADLPYERSVYVTLGTLHGDPAGFGRLLDTLQELPLNLLVTTGPAVDPTSLGPRPRHVVVERYVPQALILPRVSALVSHAGSGTMLGALAAGIPQVCLPRGADQFANAEQVARSGVGLSLVGAQASPDAVRAALLAVLDDPAFRQRTAAVTAEIDATPSAATLLDDLLALVEQRQSA